jgi:hypothetical protein
MYGPSGVFGSGATAAANDAMRRRAHRRCACALTLLLSLALVAIAHGEAVAQTSTLSIITVASPSIAVGGVLTDTAVVIGRVDPQPGATIDFMLYGPDDATCAGPPLFQSVRVPYPVEGGSVTSAGFAPADAGTYRWRAVYWGDTNNAPASGDCNDPNETVVVTSPGAVAPREPAGLPLMTPFPIVRVVGSTTPRGLRISRITVRAQVGARVVSRCAGIGRRCPYRERATLIRGPLGQVRAVRIRAFERSFRAGVVLRVFVVQAGRTGKFTSFRVRRGHPPTRADHCLAGIVLSPVPCPTS